MSLRVLLADESASIKKVFQLGLQDFAADVKTVQSGVDVIEVAESFNPDIVFADILLQKKNGYEICKELKKHATLKDIPVVLMWSSFMELDPQKYEESQAEGEMEKPFEVDAMRSHIQKLVSKAQQQQLSSFLNFSNRIKDDFVQEYEEQKEAYLSQPPAPGPSVDGVEVSAAPAEISEDLDEITQNSVFNQSAEDFSAELEETSGEITAAPPPVPDPDPEPVVPMTPPLQTSPESTLQTDESLEDFELTHNEVAVEEWRTKTLADTSTEQKTEKAELDENVEQFQSVELKADDDLELDDFLYKPDQKPTEEAEKPIVEVRTLDYTEEDNLTPPPVHQQSSSISVSRSEVEAIVRAHAQEIIKLNIQEMLPQIIEKITREELEKLLKEELKMKS